MKTWRNQRHEWRAGPQQYSTIFDDLCLPSVTTALPPLPYIIGGAVGGVAVLLIIALACVVYQRYKREDSGSVLGE